jgi:hypothetical protein
VFYVNQFASEFACLAPFMDLQVKLFVLSVSFLVDIHNLCLELACVPADMMAFSFELHCQRCRLLPAPLYHQPVAMGELG